jgi:hypothetical protein
MTTARIPFTPADEAKISSMGQWMLVVAIIHFVMGGIVLLMSCFGCVGIAAVLSQGLTGIMGAVALFFALLSGPVLVGQGVLLLQAKKSFDMVVTSDQNDQAFLAEGFTKVKIFFMIEVAYALIQVLSGCMESITPIAQRFM